MTLPADQTLATGATEPHVLLVTLTHPEDPMEGIRAFNRRRKPAFRGR